MIYCIFQFEEYGDGSILLEVFQSKEKAEKYMEIQKKLNPDYGFFIKEKEFYDDKFNENVKVVEYYNYGFNTDKSLTRELLNEINEENDCWKYPEPLIYTYDNYVNVYKDYIEGYSIESYDKAKTIALDYYEVLNGKVRELDYKVVKCEV